MIRHIPASCRVAAMVVDLAVNKPAGGHRRNTPLHARNSGVTISPEGHRPSVSHGPVELSSAVESRRMVYGSPDLLRTQPRS
jgi:hypothetical protein